MKIIIIVILCFQTINILSAQDSTEHNNKPKLAVTGGYGYNLHTGSFKKLPGIPNCCPKFESGEGYSPLFGFSFQYPLTNFYSIKVAVTYRNLKGTFDQTEPTTLIADNQIIQGEFLHHLETDLPAMTLEADLVRYLTDDVEISIGFGNAFITNPKFSQYEKVTNPASRATFIDSNGNDSHSFFRNQNNGDLPSYNHNLFYIPISINYAFPLNSKGSLKLVPEIRANLFLNPVIPDYDWKIYSFTGGISIRYDFQPNEKLYEDYKRIEKIDTIRRVAVRGEAEGFHQGNVNIDEKKEQKTNQILTTEIYTRTDTIVTARKINLKGEITANGISPSGKIIGNPVIQIEEFSSESLLPLLNYIFFDKAADEIPKRYIRLNDEDLAKFNPSKLLNADALDINHNILNIVGFRMIQSPNTKIKILGCTDGSETENGISGLAAARAESVKKYLTDTWKINPNRIGLESRALPEKFSQPTTDEEKAEENRRVELILPGDLLKPINLSDTINIVTPEKIQFKTDITSDEKVDNSSLIVKNENNVFLKSTDLNLSSPIDWNVSDDSLLKALKPDKLEYQMILQDVDGNSYQTVPAKIEVHKISVRHKREEKIHDKIIDKFSLILFDFDKSNLSGPNLEIIKMIRNKVKPNSTVNITGYTDRTGDDEHNLALSEMRAHAVYDALGIKMAAYKGIGEQTELFDNSLPEGRFYSRTVEITIETPLE